MPRAADWGGLAAVRRGADRGRDSEADWEGAAERLLHGFALSVLVPDQHYAAVSDWIDSHHLQNRVVYYRVPSRRGPGKPAHHGPGTLAAKLAVKDTPFAGWLEHELGRRADHACVETMAEFRRMPRAITKAGQIKGIGGRHEKDDRFRIDDRSRYVLGWSNQRKLDALLDQATALAARLSEVAAEQERHQTAHAPRSSGAVLAGLDQTQRVRRDRLAVRGQPRRAAQGRAARARRPLRPSWPG